MKLLAWILSLLIAVAPCDGQYSVYYHHGPASSPVIYAFTSTNNIQWKAGVDIWNSGNLPTLTPVTCTGLHNDGTTDDGPVIQACINALSSGQCALIPAGENYYVNSIVRGKSNVGLCGNQQEGKVILPAAEAGRSKIVLGSSAQITTQNFSFGFHIYPPTSYNTFPTTYCNLTGTPSMGDTIVNMDPTNGASCAPTVGGYISIGGNDNPAEITTTGEDGHCNWCGWNDGFYAAQQIVKITSIIGNQLTLSKPLYITPDPTSRTVPGPSGTGTVTEPAGVHYWIYLPQTTNFTILNLVFDGSQHDIGSTPIIRYQGCANCNFLYNETYDTGSSSGSAHMELDNSYGNTVFGNSFHDQRSGASGSGYGIYLQFVNSDHKLENNIVVHSRHFIVFQGGGSGIAVLYNDFEDGYTDDATYLASLRTSHGGHPFANLMEGNIISHATADDFAGTSSRTSYYRNWLFCGMINTSWPSGNLSAFTYAIGTLPPNEGFDCVDIYPGQSYYLFAQNVFGATSPGGFSYWPNFGAATLTSNTCGVARYGPPTAPIIYAAEDNSGGSCGTNYFPSVPDPSTTLIRQANYDYFTVGVAFYDQGTSYTLYPNSMYYTSKPSWIGSCAWPAQGADQVTKGSTSQPAFKRAHGATCP